MRYAIAKYEEYQNSMAYRIYVTDSLFYQAENQRLTKRYYDVIYPNPLDSRSGDEIAKDIIMKHGLKLGG